MENIKIKEIQLVVDTFINNINKATTQQDINTIKYLLAINTLLLREDRIAIVEQIISKENIINGILK